MERGTHHPDSTNVAPQHEVPAHIPAREQREWEVSQLADGTLPAQRRAEVEAALVSDVALRGEYAAHRRVQALLREAPAPEVDLVTMRREIMAAISDEPAYGAGRRHQEAQPATQGRAGLLGQWWITITAAAAALAIGLSLGIAFFGANRGGGGTELAGGAPAFSQLEVEGPVTILEQSQSIEQQVIALTVTGPDYRAILDPQNDAPVPSYTYSYGGSAVIETPSRMVIASADEE